MRQDVCWWRRCQQSWNVAVILMFNFSECAKDLIMVLSISAGCLRSRKYGVQFFFYVYGV